VSRIAGRIERVALRMPAPRSLPVRDLSRLTADQLTELDRLSVRYTEVGVDGLTDPELEAIGELLAILEGAPG
jgi:hypothetical protein